jgi:hypothetical protein
LTLPLIRGRDLNGVWHRCEVTFPNRINTTCGEKYLMTVCLSTCPGAVEPQPKFCEKCEETHEQAQHKAASGS